MSISSCPNCARPISIPAGVDPTAQVRCPLCRATYTLAEALVNLPPVLEVIEATIEHAHDLHDSPPEPAMSEMVGLDSEVETSAGADAATITWNAEEAKEDLGDQSEMFGITGELPATENIEFDEVSIHDKDTEVEDLEFTPSEPIVREAPEDWESLEMASPDEETTLQFDQPRGQATVDDDAIRAAEPEEGELNFDEFAATEDEIKATDTSTGDSAVTREWPASMPLHEAKAEDDDLDFGAAPADDMAGSEDETIEFGQPIGASDFESSLAAFEPEQVRQPPADDDEIALDFGEPVDDDSAAAPVESQSAPEGETPQEKKKREKREKKEQKEQAKAAKKKQPVEASAEGQPPRRSMARTLVSVILGAIVAIPLTLYGMLWLGKDYDFLNVGGKLYAWSVPLPKEFGKSQPGRTVAIAPGVLPGQPPPGMSPPANQPEPETPADETSQVPAAPATAAPPTEAPATAPAEAPPAAPASEPVEKQAPEPAAQPATAPVEPPSLEPAAAQPPAAQPSPAVPMPPAGEPAQQSSPAPATSEPAVAEPAPPAEADPKKATPDEKARTIKDGAPVAADEQKQAEPPGDQSDKSFDDLLEMPDEPAPDKSAATASPAAASDAPMLGDESAPSTDAPADDLGPVDGPEFSTADLAKAAHDAATADHNMATAQTAKDEAAIKSARANLYLSLFRLAEVLTFASDSASAGQLATERQTVEQAMLQFAADKKRLDALKFNAGRWLGFSKRTTTGIVLAGTVQSAEPTGQLKEIKLALGSGADSPVVSIVQEADSHLQTGDRALVLGTIVEDPAERLVGYTDNEPLVIWSGMTIKLPEGK